MLPDHELILQGIDDLRHGRHAQDAPLVLIGAERPGGAGLQVPEVEIPRAERNCSNGC